MPGSADAARGWSITDPRPIAASAPYTYFIPTEEERAAVGEGDLVQLVFELDPPGERWTAEHMWVRVTDAGPENLAGVLETDPDDAPLTKGDTIAFRRGDAIKIVWRDPANAPPPSSARQYWERCLVDACVVDGAEPVEFVYREEPEADPQNDQPPDSGWRIRGRRGDASDAEMEARAVLYVALGAVLNRDDSWLHLIDAPIGSAFMRDFGTGEFVSE